MAVKLHRCGTMWLKIDAHPCWRGQKSLDEAGGEYEVVKHPLMRGKRTQVEEKDGQKDPPANGLGFGPDPRSQYEYWAHRDDPRLRFRNCGIYGERTSQIAARLRACARGADVLIVQGGINDIAQSLQGPAPLRRLAVTNAATNL